MSILIPFFQQLIKGDWNNSGGGLGKFVKLVNGVDDDYSVLESLQKNLVRVDSSCQGSSKIARANSLCYFHLAPTS